MPPVDYGHAISARHERLRPDPDVLYDVSLTGDPRPVAATGETRARVQSNSSSHELQPMLPDEAARLAAVRRYDILDTPPDGAFDRITALAARLFNVPVAIVSVVDEDRIWFKSHHGLDVQQIDRTPGLCASAILDDQLWVVSNAPRDPRALANPLVAGEFGLRFYAGAPLHTTDGHNLGTLCIIDFKPRELTPDDAATLRDLAQMVMSELELRLASRQAVGEASERERLKDVFIGMLSHELRTPTTTIYAASQLLGRSAIVRQDAQANDLVADILSDSERLVRLIEDFLVLTKLERGSLETRAEPVLLQRVLGNVVARESERSGRVIYLHASPDLPPAAGDALYVEQVGFNLISNAIKYSPPDEAIDVSVHLAAGGVQVSVRDRGIGIPTDHPDAVFDLLVRAPDAARLASGAGIGLYVCRRLVQAMRGAIWAHAAPDVGTVFTFQLPTADGAGT